MATVKLAFERDARSISLDLILPVRSVPDAVRGSQKYRRIQSSILEVGVIEPLVVHPQKKVRGKPRQYLLLDGHLRHDALVVAGETHALCLIATEDEEFTYNHKVNQISAIQEHLMILKAIETGVSEERLARALSVDIATIRKKRDLLDGICPEAIEIIEKRGARPGALREIKRVKPMRQIEMAELMVASKNFSAAYAKCLVAATAQEQLVNPDSPKEINELRPEDVARMEREMQALEIDFRSIEEKHGRNLLNLVLAVGYLRGLLDNVAVVKYVSRHHHDLFAELERIVASTDMGGDALAAARAE